MTAPSNRIGDMATPKSGDVFLNCLNSFLQSSLPFEASRPRRRCFRRGATVTVTSPNLISSQTATTNDSGRYTILSLPPGSYKITVEGSGFAKFEQGGVAVNLGRTSSGDAQLKLASVGATVTVVGGATVDTAQNTTGTNISTEAFSNFPTQRTVQGLYTIAPTVARSVTQGPMR